MRSISNAWFRAKQAPTAQPSLASSLTVEDDEGHIYNPVDSYAAPEPNTEELLVFRETVARIDDLLVGDEEARMILEGLRDGREPSGIRELWGFSQTQYDTIVIRMRRKIRRAGIVQPEKGAAHV